MELRHIRYFVRAAELLHFTRAAESLYVSQPTLSAHISQLEEELKLALFDRVGRNVQLTKAGAVFLDHARRTLQEIDLAQVELQSLKELSRGTIKIGALFTFGPDVLPRSIASFNSRYAQIGIIVSSGSSDFVEDELLNGRIDLGLSFVPPESSDLKHEVLFEEQIYLVVNDQHPLTAKKQVALDDLATIPLALVSRRYAARRLYDAYFAKHEISPNIVVEIEDLQALMEIIRTSSAGALMSGMAAANHAGLTLIPLAGAPLAIDYGVLWHTQTHLSPPTQAFLDHLRSERQERQSSR